MTDRQGAALQIARKYFETWTSGDFDAAAAYIDGEIVCDAPAGRLKGAAAFREFMEPFTRIVTHAQLVAAFGSDTRRWSSMTRTRFR